MNIKPLQGDVARAATNGLRFMATLEEVALDMFHWQKKLHGPIVPASFPLPDPRPTTSRSIFKDSAYYQRRSTAIQNRLKQEKRHIGGKKKSPPMSYLIAGGHVWHLTQSGEYKDSISEHLVKENAAFYVKLILQKELLERSRLAIASSNSTRELGPGVYLFHKARANGRKIQLTEALFDVIPKYRRLICNIRSCIVTTRETECDMRIGQLDTGCGYMAEVVALDTASVSRLDARKSPIRGISLRKTEFRRSRLYYLNILTEFAISVFQQAGIHIERELFVASHVVPDAYLSLAAIAQLKRPLVVANATAEPTPSAAIPALGDLKSHFPRGYHIHGGLIDFAQPAIIQTAVPDSPARELNYLFLNGSQPNESSVRIYDDSKTAPQPASTAEAYDFLKTEGGRTDLYTRIKYDCLINRDTFNICLQGIDESPSTLSEISNDDTILQTRREKLKRCLVELSLKEIVAGAKPFPTSVFSDVPCNLTLIGTRTLKTSHGGKKTLISTASVDISSTGILVRGTHRTPWGAERNANLSFVEQFPFLLSADGKVRDNQFWIVDATTAKRLCVWSGNFVPKIILNDRYAGVEAALASQRMQDHRIDNGSFYSKSKVFNILPYYISLRDEKHTVTGEQAGQLIALQDCGAWVRAFIPPADGIDGTGSNMSGMRDLMLYNAAGEAIIESLLDEPLVQIYLHSMTNGILVAGENSKMSILEKFVRLTLGN